VVSAVSDSSLKLSFLSSGMGRQNSHASLVSLFEGSGLFPLLTILPEEQPQSPSS
jgi:hypothetical protein